jgi:hypothetical protein
MALTNQIGEDDHHRNNAEHHGMRQALPNLPLYLPSLTNYEDNAHHIPYHSYGKKIQTQRGPRRVASPECLFDRFRQEGQRGQTKNRDTALSASRNPGLRRCINPRNTVESTRKKHVRGRPLAPDNATAP